MSFIPNFQTGKISCDCCGVFLSEGRRPEREFALCNECQTKSVTIAGQTLAPGVMVEYGYSPPGIQGERGRVLYVTGNTEGLVAEVERIYLGTGSGCEDWHVYDHKLTTDPASGECWTRVVG